MKHKSYIVLKIIYKQKSLFIFVYFDNFWTFKPFFGMVIYERYIFLKFYLKEKPLFKVFEIFGRLD